MIKAWQVRVYGVWLRELAKGAEVGGEVGADEDEPGLLSTIEQLRRDAALILEGGGPLETAAMAPESSRW